MAIGNKQAHSVAMSGVKGKGTHMCPSRTEMAIRLNSGWKYASHNSLTFIQLLNSADAFADCTKLRKAGFELVRHPGIRPPTGISVKACRAACHS